MKISASFIYRVLLYTLGLLLAAFGVAFAINSGLGVSPVNSLSYVLSEIFGVQFGHCVIAVFSSCILLQIIVLRREFKLRNLFQIVFSILFGYFADFAKWLVGDFTIPTYAGQLAMLGISIVVLGVGLALVVGMNLIPMSTEGLMLALVEKIKKISFPNMKVIVDCSFVVISVSLALIFTGGIIGVREGTVITALLVGRVIGLMQGPIKKIMKSLQGDGENEREEKVI